MKQVKVTNEIKKSVVETETWHHKENNQYVTFETVWRFATYTLNLEDDVELEAIYATNESGFCVHDFDVEDMDATDGISFDITSAWSPGEQLTEDQQTSIMDGVLELWEEDGWGGLETAGWDHIDTEAWMYGPLEVQEVSND